jgi:hypothetical protein
LDWSQADIENPSVFRVIFFLGKGFSFQQVIQNLPDLLKSQVEVGEDVEQEVPVVEWIKFHAFPREKFGPILAKNKISIKIFFDSEQYVGKLLVAEILGRASRRGGGDCPLAFGRHPLRGGKCNRRNRSEFVRDDYR